MSNPGKKYKVVLFDYDGTIMDSNRLIVESWNYMYSKYCGKTLTAEDIKWTFGMLLADGIDELMKSKGHTGYNLEWLKGVYREYQTFDRVKGAEPFEGMPDVIRELKSRGITLGIVTSRVRKSLMDGLDKFGLTEYFDYIVADDSTENHKPFPDPAIICLEKLGARAEDALMIGDSVFDLQCAKGAGCDSCFVSWSFATSLEKALKEGKPDYVIDTPSQILEFV